MQIDSLLATTPLPPLSLSLSLSLWYAHTFSHTCTPSPMEALTDTPLYYALDQGLCIFLWIVCKSFTARFDIILKYFFRGIKFCLSILSFSVATKITNDLECRKKIVLVDFSCRWKNCYCCCFVVVVVVVAFIVVVVVVVVVVCIFVRLHFMVIYEEF